MKRRKFLCTAYILCALITLIFCYGFISSYEVSYFLGIQIQPAQRIASDCETLNIAMVIAGYETTNRAVILLKSILFYYQQRIHFHFITDHRSMDVLPKLFNTWQLADVEYSFYNSTNYINRVNWIPNNHYSKHFGLIKLLLADILPEDVKKVLLLDTDLLIVGEIQELIDSFSKLTNGKLYGLVENMSRWYTTQDPIHHVWPALGSGFNTGVALINLDAMRKIRWNHIWRTVAEENLKYYGRTMLADQDIINAIFVQNPHFIHRLPCKRFIQ
ncbi:unnamed protein product, partial [Mesorhabditis belari]|uniref:Uncharacterized protein n=1 Tax=Mesorhabditis belari TaxID=2138241 RepID=A0AAF3FB39_9BILA